MNPLRNFLAMRRDLAAARPAIDVWGAVLNVPLLAGGLVFVYTVEGALVLASTLLSLVVAPAIHRRRPLSRLMGLSHLPWLALIPALVFWLFARDHGHGIVFQAWLVYAVAVMTVSTVFDVVDVWRWAATGNKTYAEPGRARRAGA
jgi:hypothetical protein